MRLCSFVANGRASYGLVTDTGIVDAGRRLAAPSLKQALADLPAQGKLVGEKPDHELDTVQWLPVIPDAGKVFSVLLNYEALRLEAGRPKLQFPHLLTRFADTQVGHKAALMKPKISNEFDFEGELAVVIGKPGRNIARAAAMEHVAGYACYNDATPRDWMRHSRHFTLAKSFPGTGGFGPWLTTRDALPDLSKSTLTTRLNGEIMQQAQLGNFTYPVEELISYISQATPLNAGDVICTGTPGGCGYKRSPPRFLKPGDDISVSIDGIGTLSNTVAEEA
ncbi:fumarylacetoacetate hydrolase family protein [Ferrovibrio sp.]|uniref:fumarylacetoacetate hydrolase family protein n=1 Tax=Ferrovibrio sp. TaxID=1917215 RepID=UPI0035B0315E